MSNSDEFSQCPCTGKTLARIIQPAVLALLAGKPLHGYVIVQQLKGLKMFQGESPDPAGVYRVLRAMEQRGLLTASWDTGRAGPAKRQFTITERGQACLNRWGRTLEEYAESIGDLLATIHSACNGRRTAR